ncbi:hypothetical protein Pint_22763 [Pistacia integerrima]|uniref:Uncharacterized protein n=1 Tax=Pistacia integerrima TaxID=434235 RepID=A0ACC0YJX4_9ROSI|nr:hypothetical protein Pint_22763 [Pistacia integerrima]
MKISKIETASDSSGKVNEEERVLSYDLRLARRWKRRRIASEKFTCRSHKASKQTVNSDIKNNKNYGSAAEGVVVDSDYEVFLNDMVQYVDVDSDVGCANNVNDADKDDVGEVLDSQYMMFVDNLKEDGKSYMLDFAPNNGTSVVVRYEEENGSRNELVVENFEDHQSEGNIEIENILRSQLDKENIEDHVSSRDIRLLEMERKYKETCQGFEELLAQKDSERRSLMDQIGELKVKLQSQNSSEGDGHLTAEITELKNQLEEKKKKKSSTATFGKPESKTDT